MCVKFVSQVLVVGGQICDVMFVFCVWVVFVVECGLVFVDIDVQVYDCVVELMGNVFDEW